MQANVANAPSRALTREEGGTAARQRGME